MAELFKSGRVVEIIVALMLIEAAAMFLFHRGSGRGVAMSALLPNLAAGAALLLALREALLGHAWEPIAACLLVALMAHLTDLKARWNGTNGAASATGSDSSVKRMG